MAPNQLRDAAQAGAPRSGRLQMATVAASEAVLRLNPKFQWRNPVMFVTEVGAALVTVEAARLVLDGGRPCSFEVQIACWLWFTVLFANFAEALAEGRGKAQAESLRRARSSTVARLLSDGRERSVPATDLRAGDVVVCEAGDVVPADGEVIEGVASVDESAVTGESAPVIRESGGDRSAVTGGTRVISDRIVIRVTAEPGGGFIDRMIALVEGASRRKTPNEIALSMVLSGLSLAFLATVAALKPFLSFSGGSSAGSIASMTALLVCLIPTTIGGLLSAIGISGMDRLIRRNVVATSGRAVEAAGDVDVLLLDKTGTITLGNRMAVEFIPCAGVSVERLAEAAQTASLADETPEGRSIVVLAKEMLGLRGPATSARADFIPFSARTRMSGVDVYSSDGKIARSLRKGAAEAAVAWVEAQGGRVTADLGASVERVARSGGTPLVVAEGAAALGIVRLKDVVKGGIRERFAELRRMGIRTVMITGDNPLTAAAIAAEAGVDDFMAEATPEDKLARIREEQGKGRLVAMTGDGTNDAPALAQADVGVAMNTGTQAAREAGNMVDLDSNPTKLIEIVEIGKQLLMTRGALTTFSIANDVAKYFAILPAMFGGLYVGAALSASSQAAGALGPLASLNVMGLRTPESAVLSAVIFNALIIVALIPLALKGVRYRPDSAAAVLRRNALIYGAGGIVAPFVGIKAIDALIGALGLV